MKKFALILFSCCVSASPLWAAESFADADIFRNVYETIDEKYIQPIPVGDVVPAGVKGLRLVDKNLRIGDDDKRITLYYKAVPYRSFLKPQKPHDIEGAVKLTGRIIDAAKKASPKAAAKDFDLADILLEYGINKGLDGDSKYYPLYNTEKKGDFKNKRQFADRMIDGILYVKILAFNKYTVASFNQAISENPQFDGMILDLRGSPGGLFGEAMKIANNFLDEGIMAISRDRKDKVTYYTSFPGDKINDKPLVILVDGATASSAEVITAGLQEQGRAQVVGTKTYGKGTMQELISLSNGAELGLTTAYFYTPSDKPLHKIGIRPDICTSQIDERKDIAKFLLTKQPEDCLAEAREGKDFDIEAAVEMIKHK